MSNFNFYVCLDRAIGLAPTGLDGAFAFDAARIGARGRGLR
jgi:hypothetical protein